MSESFWKRCASCKREIGFDRVYWKCSVSTCDRKGTGFAFCSVACFDAHVPTMRHREAWADEERSPTESQWGAERGSPPPAARAAAAASAPASPSHAAPSSSASGAIAEIPHDILIVASKLKAYVRARSGMSTSDAVVEVLSRKVRALCDDAIGRAREAGRKTVMDRDF